MKKTLVLIVLLFSVISLSAKLIPVADLCPFFTFDSTPSGMDSMDWKTASGIQNPQWWETKQDYWADAFDKPVFLNLGFELDTDKVDMVVLVDVMQDIFVLMRDHETIYSNVPFLNKSNLDLTFPRVGYIDYTADDLIYLSVGRRQIKCGPGTYGMALSDSQPYLDNVYFNVILLFQRDGTSAMIWWPLLSSTSWTEVSKLKELLRLHLPIVLPLITTGSGYRSRK